MKKAIVALMLAALSKEIPVIEWPEVQPPAYLVPKPTNSPPMNSFIKPITE